MAFRHLEMSDIMPRPRILLIGEAVTLAHVARPLSLAQDLDPDRYEIELAFAPRYHHLLPDLAFPVHDLDSIPGERFLAALASGRPLYDLETLEHYVEDDLALLSERRPDVVIGDFRLSLAVSAPLLRIPYLAISNAYWSPFARQHFPVPELPLVKALGVGIAQPLFDLARPLAFACHALPMHRLRRRYGLPSLGLDLRRVYTHADHTLYADLADWVQMQTLPDNHHFLGPLHWSPAVALPSWWDDLPADRPLVYVNLGSSGCAELLPALCDALHPLGLDILAATAGRSPQLPTDSSRIHLADYLPGEVAAARAQLVICNGGSLAVYQALAAGVPVLGLPSNLDQFLNMASVVRHGVGLCLRASRADAGTVRQAVHRLLESPVYRENARHFQSRISESSGSTVLDRLLSAITRT